MPRTKYLAYSMKRKKVFYNDDVRAFAAVLLGDVPQRLRDLPVDDPLPPKLAPSPRNVKVEKMQLEALSARTRLTSRFFQEFCARNLI